MTAPPVPKTWLAIPALALACAGVGFAVTLPVHAALAIGALGAALAAAVRAFAGPSIAAAVAGAAAAALGALGIVELATLEVVHEVARAALAGAAAMFAIAELARPMPPAASPLPAIGAALVAGVLDPSYAVLLAIAGVRWVRGPWSRPRGAIAAPIAGTLLVLTAVVAHAGLVPELWLAWTDRATHPASPVDVLAHLGDVLGPITAVAALAGLATCAARGRYAASAVVGVLAGALAADLATGAIGAPSPIVAALGAGVGIARLTAFVRWPAGQAFVGVAAGFMMVLAPAWALALR